MESARPSLGPSLLTANWHLEEAARSVLVLLAGLEVANVGHWNPRDGRCLRESGSGRFSERELRPTW